MWTFGMVVVILNKQGVNAPKYWAAILTLRFIKNKLKTILNKRT